MVTFIDPSPNNTAELVMCTFMTRSVRRKWIVTNIIGEKTYNLMGKDFLPIFLWQLCSAHLSSNACVMRVWAIEPYLKQLFFFWFCFDNQCFALLLLYIECIHFSNIIFIISNILFFHRTVLCNICQIIIDFELSRWIT